MAGMTVSEFQELKQKVERAKTEKSKTEGQLEQIMKGWKSEYGLNSPEEVQDKIDELTESEAEINTKIESAKKRVIECLPMN